MSHFEPYSYQKEVAKLLHSGQNVILQAPTGAGKTAAALLPFLHAGKYFDSTEFPRKCIYSVPMRVLAKHFESEYKQLAKRNAWEDKVKITIQTGEQPEDRQLEGDLIFATIDQSLSSLLGVPYALSSRQANLNAGAVIGAYLVFDEYHLFPTTKTAGVGALGATLQILKLLKGIIPFCLMTATFSEAMIRQLADLLGAKVVTVGEQELVNIETANGEELRKTRRFQVSQTALPESAQEMIKSPAQRIIAICNRVERAQRLYQELVEALGEEQVILLHARFLKTDRQRWEQAAERELGKNDKNKRTPGKVVLVATQVVEVGLDISCDELHTEVAPANAVIQRAGRCARRPGESGLVIIHPLPEASEDDKMPFLPYDEELCSATLNVFRQEEYNNQIIRFEQEQQIINLVHNEDDQELLASLKNRERETLEAIEETMMFGETGERRGLIRSINNVTLLVHAQPEQLGNPFACEGFSLYTGSLKGKWDLLLEWAEELDLGWPLKYPIADEEAKQRNKKRRQRPDENSGQAEPEYVWRDLTHPSLIHGYPVLAIHPCLIIYNERLGFRLAQSDGAFTTEAAPARRGSRRDPYTYELESYSQHIENMLRIYRRDFQDQLAYVAHRLQEQLNLNPGAVEKAIQLVIALHDVGKLDTRWQQWARNYQSKISNSQSDTRMMIAHTHSQTDEHRETAKRIKPQRPYHAGEGAAASMLILQEFVKQYATDKAGGQGLYRAMLTAITRHHHAQSNGCQEYHLHPEAPAAIQAVLKTANLDDLAVKLAQFRPNSLEENLLSTENRNYLNWFLYFVLVRPLILCDHKSLAEK